MITDGSTLSSGTVLNTQVCVIGSGPAGITVAWNLQKAGINVILLEGSRDVGLGPNYVEKTWPDKERLYNGKAVGLFANNEFDFLIRPQGPGGPSERERAFGGTSTHWGGQSRPLDAVALEGRGDTYPAWPVTRAELDPWYAAAASFCNIADNFDANYWASVLGAEVPKVQNFDTAMYQYVGPYCLNFATRTFSDGSTIYTSNAAVIINATLQHINHAGGRVQSLTVASMTRDNVPKPNTEFTVIADRYVLALGAVANARQLLLSDVPNDNIGRYFMCHPLVWGNPVVTADDFLTDPQTRLLQGHLPNGSRWYSQCGVALSGRLSPSAEQQQAKQMGSCWVWGNGGQALYFEQAPNPASRITLAGSTDSVFGQPQTHIDWQFSPADEYTYTQNMKLLGEVTTVNYWDWSEIQSNVVVNGHHLGTTRMSETAADGVVDSNLRSHDLSNLFIAGSSVWRTACIPNPTFSIIMFSMRLAAYLEKDLGVTNKTKGSPSYAEG
jgi:choline dehydrogenase-like flavoprotein